MTREKVLKIKPKNHRTNITLHVVVGAVNRDNDIIYYYFTNDKKYKLEKCLPKIHDPHPVCFSLGKREAVDKLKKRIYKEMTLEDVINVQSKINTEISHLDKTVNTTTFHEAISLTNY
ncbi:hypothetical protein [Salipaludibacillus neizhouensis]|uniref:hypothetical protein n=1 Tax=Salipaludibacillus neizhouensis TaxID=885475 RepID=UPI001601A4C7|nr:hypothetical protein [Salipaludibacillus neizhouensis]